MSSDSILAFIPLAAEMSKGSIEPFRDSTGATCVPFSKTASSQTDTKIRDRIGSGMIVPIRDRRHFLAA
jgi:hypothetical protein